MDCGTYFYFVDQLWDWLLAAIDSCDARGWTCIPHVHFTGSPELDWWPVIRPALCEMARRGHLFGMNIYPYYPVTLALHDGQTQYTTYRFELFPDTCDVQFAVTELAPDGGGWAPDVEDTGRFIKLTLGEFALVGVWYYGGNNPLPAWPAANWSITDMLNLATLLRGQ